MHLSIESIEFSDSNSTTLSLPKGGLLIIVGPNNSGKSTALRELNSRLVFGNNYKGNGVTYNVIKGVNLRKEGTADDLVAWLDEKGKLNKTESSNPNTQINEQAARAHWVSIQAIGELWNLLSYYGVATQRVTNLASQQYDPRRTVPTTPLQIIWSNKKIEDELSSIMMSAFGVPLSINRSSLTMRLYTKKLPRLNSDIPTDTYLDALESYPEIDGQGDGMRSFVEVLVNLKVKHNFCVVIDEPEAFLHPPQAILLGEQLKTSSGEDTQIVLATHSSDIVKGTLSNARNTLVTIVRLTREGDELNVKLIDANDIKKLWSDSSLRYSNLLDGVFNNAVILCEADADCRFYAAVMDSLPKNKNRYSSSDLLFAPVGGKHKIKKVADSFTKLGVPVRAIADLDLLNDKRLFKDTFEALGGDWSNISSDYETIKTFINSLPGALEGSKVKTKLKAITTSLPDTSLDRSHVKSINDVTRGFATSWGILKLKGARVFSSSSDKEAFKRIVATTKKSGLFLVGKGEMERFINKSDVNSLHGEKWVTKVLEMNYHVSAANGSAGTFVKSVIAKKL